MAAPSLVSVSDLPDEIIFTILQNFPVKSLLKFMCVSKTWKSIITSQTFVLSYNGPQRNLYFYDSCQSLTFLESSLAAVGDQVMPSSFFECPSLFWTLHSSCNGLFLFTHRSVFESKLCLWNPSIRKQKILPATNFKKSPSECRPNFTVGLGFDSTTNDYKVVRVESFQNSLRLPRVEIYSLSTNSWRSLGVEIYSLSTNSWRSLESPDSMFRIIPSFTSAYIDGVFYCFGVRFDENKRIRYSILSFDFSEEIFREVKLPNDLNGFKNTKLRLFAFKGLLTLISNFDHAAADNDEEMIFIWKMMKESLWMREEVKFSEIEPLIRHKLILKNCIRTYLYDPRTVCEKAVQLQQKNIYATRETLLLL